MPVTSAGGGNGDLDFHIGIVDSEAGPHKGKQSPVNSRHPTVVRHDTPSLASIISSRDSKGSVDSLMTPLNEESELPGESAAAPVLPSFEGAGLSEVWHRIRVHACHSS